MPLAWTLVMLAAGLALGGFCLWHQRRPRRPGDVSIFPATFLLGVGLILTVVALGHLVTLVTGVPLRGRLATGP
ncbi:hypothetical protein SH611_03780 [Geminicoccaceae bacterium 1502E]|nr:hypothetical protein [Geminicoccaceae bacterium 1502E]